MLANDSDPEGEAMQARVIEATPGVQVGYDGSMRLPTRAQAAGTTPTFTYTAEDALGDGNTPTVTVDVLAPDTGEPPPEPRCGCGTVDPGAASPLVLLATLLARRRGAQPLHLLPVPSCAGQ